MSTFWCLNISPIKKLFSIAWIEFACVLLVFSCAAKVSEPTIFVADTAADPVPYRPGFAREADTRGSYTVRMTDGSQSPREVMLTFFQAILEGDESTLRRLASDDLEGGRTRRAGFLFWDEVHRLREPLAADVRTYIVEHTVREQSVGESGRWRRSRRIQLTDRVLYVPLTNDGRRIWSELTGRANSQQATFIIRASQGRVIAIE